MLESPQVGARVPQDWQQQIQEIAQASGRKEAEVVREASAQYLRRTDPGSVIGKIGLSIRKRQCREKPLNPTVQICYFRVVHFY